MSISADTLLLLPLALVGFLADPLPTPAQPTPYLVGSVGVVRSPYVHLLPLHCYRRC